jgi:hypothetical protein
MSVFDDILKSVPTEDRAIFDKYPQLGAAVEKMEADLNSVALFAGKWVDWQKENWDPDAGMTRTERQLRDLLAASHARLASCLEMNVESSNPEGPDHKPVVDKRTSLERAEQGDPEAQYRYGYHYAFGPEEVRDYTVASEWWTKAAENGCVNAQAGLWLIYSEGLGVPQDHLRAYLWISVAAKRALGDSQKRFIDLRDTTAGFLTPVQLAEAQDLIPQWDARIGANLQPEFDHIFSWDLDRYNSGTILDEGELAAIEDHLVACPKCRAQFRDERMIHRALIAAGFTRRKRI